MRDAMPVAFVIAVPTIPAPLLKKVTVKSGVASDTVVDKVTDSPTVIVVTDKVTFESVASTGGGVGEGDGVGSVTVKGSLEGDVIV